MLKQYIKHVYHTLLPVYSRWGTVTISCGGSTSLRAPSFIRPQHFLTYYIFWSPAALIFCQLPAVTIFLYCVKYSSTTCLTILFVFVCRLIVVLPFIKGSLVIIGFQWHIHLRYMLQTHHPWQHHQWWHLFVMDDNQYQADGNAA